MHPSRHTAKPQRSNAPHWTALLGFLLLSLTACSQKAPDHPFLPWDITVYPDGTSAVFGVHLGKDPLLQFKRVYNQKAELAMFADKNKHLSLEAYFGQMQVGALSANVVLVAQVSQDQLKKWADQTGKLESTPSGAWKMELPDDIIRKAQNLPIRSISYVPSASYSKKLIRHRFGEPQQILETEPAGDEPRKVIYWLYPAKGLMITVNDDGKDVFQYIAPKQFDQLKRTLPKDKKALSDKGVSKESSNGAN